MALTAVEEELPRKGETCVCHSLIWSQSVEPGAFLMVSTTTLRRDRELIRHGKGDRCRKVSTVREGGRGRTASAGRRIAPTIPSFPSLSLVPLPCILNVLHFVWLEWQMSEGRAKNKVKRRRRKRGRRGKAAVGDARR